MNTFRASSLPLDDSRFGYGEHMSDAAKAWSQTYTERMQHADDRGMLAGPEAQAAYQQQMGARGMGMTGLGYMADVVSGRGPTQAEQMSARAAQRAQAQQMSMAASARGGGPAAALAQYQAQNAGSAAAADIAGQGMVQAGMERQQLAGALASGAAGMRGQDQAMMAMGLQNRAMNDQRYMGLMGAQQDVYKQQLLANIEHQRLQQQGHIAADTTNAKINEFNANQELNGGGLGGFVSDMGGGMLGGIF
jgi:hypothetical protein